MEVHHVSGLDGIVVQVGHLIHQFGQGLAQVDVDLVGGGAVDGDGQRTLEGVGPAVHSVDAVQVGLDAHALAGGLIGGSDGGDGEVAVLVVLELLGLERNCNLSEEEVYEYWFSRVCSDSIDLVNRTVDQITAGVQREVVYQWDDPKLGIRYVRCGGVCEILDDGTRIIEGYHSDITEEMDQRLRDEIVLKAFASIFYCLFYIDLDKDTYVANFNRFEEAARVIPKTGCFSKALSILPERLCPTSEKEKMRQFADLSTLKRRLKDQNCISIKYRGIEVSWLRLAFVVSGSHADGTPHYLVATVTDISEEMEKDAQKLKYMKESIEANRSKTMMLQNMTHEIRTPLNAMFGFSQLLSMPEETVSNDEKREYFNYIYNSFNMLSMLIDDVLDMANAEHGNYKIQKSEFKVNEMCRSAVQMVEMRLMAGVKMYFTSEVDDNYTVVSDCRRIEQVLINFLTNSCKHTRKGEIHLHLSTTENPGRLTFSVADTGTGVSKDVAKDVFERYKKADDNTQGSGLGLNICKTIADKLGAEIKLDETYTGGARFVFVLPIG